MNRVFLIAMLGMLVACVPPEEAPRHSSGREVLTPEEVCLNGVVYYRFRNAYGSSHAPKFKPDSTVETCN